MYSISLHFINKTTNSEIIWVQKQYTATMQEIPLNNDSVKVVVEAAAKGPLSPPLLQSFDETENSLSPILRKLRQTDNPNDAFEVMWPLSRFIDEHNEYTTRMSRTLQFTVISTIILALKKFSNSPKFVSGAITILGLYITKDIDEEFEIARYRMLIDVSGIPLLISIVKNHCNSDQAALVVVMLSSISYISPKTVATDECIAFMLTAMKENPSVVQVAKKYFERIQGQDGVRDSLVRKGYYDNILSYY